MARYRKKLITILLLVLINLSYFPAPARAATPWYSSGGNTWNYRQKIVIDHTKISTVNATTLSNFPVLVSTTNVLFKSLSNGGHVSSSVGNDILFTGSDGTTKLNHEIELYTPTTGNVIAWVNVTSLSPTVDTVIYMYYGGNANVNQQNKTAVWDANYKGVWHLPTVNGSLTANDSTGVNNGVLPGSPPTAIAGQIDGAANFPTASNIAVDSMSVVAGSKTFSFWLKPGNNSGYIFDSAVGRLIIDTGLNAPNADSLSFFDGSWHSLSSAGSLPGGSTHYATVVLDASLSTAIGYIDGIQQTTSAYASVAIGGGSTKIGSHNNGSNPYNGWLDEFRISNSVRTADWIKTEYNNQNSPSTFHTFTGEENRIQTNVNGAWFNASWGFRKKITIDHSKVSGTTALTNFPVLVSLTDTDLKNKALASGNDILFTGSNGTTKLNYERELYTTSTGNLIAWVQVPSLSPTTDTVIYMYYGNAGASDQQSVAATWDTNYKAVWHLPNGAAISANDSTGVNNGTLVGTPAPVAGQVDGAATIKRNNPAGDNYITVGNDSSLNITGNTLSVEFWLQRNNTSLSGSNVIFSRNTAGVGGYKLGLEGSNTTNSLSLAKTTLATITFGSVPNDTNWHHVVAVDSGGRISAYVDGAESVGIVNDAANILSATATASIGPANQGSSNNTYNIDELRVSNTARPANWITTEYNNQLSPTTFSSIAGEETNGNTSINTSWYSTSWGFRKAIVINHNKVNRATGSATPLANFPVLVSLTDTDLKNNALASGNDILFTSSDGLTKLNYERELYTTSTGNLIAWVNVPSLSSTVDTTLYMYFGNASAADQQNATAVWDANYKGVWHLPNGSSLSVADSTGTSTATNNGATPTAGKIDGGTAVASGSSQYIDTGLTPTGLTNFTIEAWASETSLVADEFVLSSRNLGTTGGVFMFYEGTNNHGPKVGFSNGANLTMKMWGANLSTGVYHHIVATHAAGSTAMTLYVDGVAGGSVVNNAASDPANAATFVIGRDGLDATPFYFTGSVDETRFSNTARTADWINTEYLNQSSPATFAGVGGLQKTARASNKGSVSIVGGVTPTSWTLAGGTWTSRKTITISHSLVSTVNSTTLSGFPMLVCFNSTSPCDRADTELKTVANSGKMGRSDGKDIVFTTLGGAKLSYELEKYDPVSGETVAWVKVPSLSPATDTQIYLYLGNASASDQSNKTGVWDSNYKGVWHLPDGSNLSGADSITGGHTMNNAGGVTATTGQIDGAGSFSGSSNSFMNTGAFALSSTPSIFTFSAWAKFNTLSGRFTIFGTTPNNTGNNWSIEGGSGNGSNTLSLLYPGSFMNTSSYPADTTHWHFVEYERDSNTSCGVFYIDGVAENPISTGACNVTFADNGEAKTIGARTSNQFFNGSIDDVRYSKIVRTPDWIKTEYNNQNSPSTFFTVSVSNPNILRSASTPLIKNRGGVKFH